MGNRPMGTGGVRRGGRASFGTSLPRDRWAGSMRTGLEEEAMRCDVCGNDYDKSFQVVQLGKTMTFDSFECAIHALAPVFPRHILPRHASRQW